MGYKLQEGRNHIYFAHFSVFSNKLNACHTEDTEYIFIKYINTWNDKTQFICMLLGVWLTCKTMTIQN